MPVAADGPLPAEPIFSTALRSNHCPHPPPARHPPTPFHFSHTSHTSHAQGVAIETRGFTFVTSGKKRETLTGEATLRFFDHLSDFGKFDGIMPNIFTEISTVG